MNLPALLLSFSTLFYVLAALFHLFSFLDLREKGHAEAASMLRLGFMVSVFYFIAEANRYGTFLPVISHDQAMAFFAGSLAFVYLVLLARIQSASFGLILNPVLFFLMGFAALTRVFCKDIHVNVRPELLQTYFVWHVLSAFFAYACFGISFAAGVLYLIQHRELKNKHAGRFYHKLPSLEELERLVFQPLLWGVPLLFTALVLGLVWSKSAYGVYWTRDPKTLTTLAILLIYTSLLYFRQTTRLSSKQIALWSSVTFMLVMVTFVGVRFIHGSHNYFQ
ncbi:MAG: hypothetical protein EXS63_05780 [Candidatus Omnitrophica bacterium]|nr:hypothetical protein [Candidatus Omnitrophota bacterium]